MVLGTPGSGKTSAIVVLIKILAKMKKRVLVVSFTNSAIDNVLGRLKDTGFKKFVRITNNIASVDKNVQSNVKTNSMFENMKQIQQVIDDNYIFGTTCLQVNNNFLHCLKFDYCIMDEASQISEPLSVGPILLA
jgi:DNA replication ATP-dependent helicase Dna2